MKFQPYQPQEEIDRRRRHLPHWRQDGGCYFITFRLADSLPQTLLQRWREEKETWLANHPEPWSEEEKKDYFRLFPQRREDWLDAGYGECHLRRPEIREIVEESLEKFDGKRYSLDFYVVMPNHVHLVWQLDPKCDLSAELKGLKGGSSRLCNQALNRSGQFWMDESYDHLIRDTKELQAFRNYIEKNPEKAGLGTEHYSLYIPYVLEV